MSFIQLNRIALIPADSDPAFAPGQDDADGQNVYVRHLSEALTRQDWQVDIFTRRTNSIQPEIFRTSHDLRFIYLIAGPEVFIDKDNLFIHLPKFINEFIRFQHQEDVRYQLTYTIYWLSGWVGLELKRQQSFIHVHTCCSLAAKRCQGSSSLSSRSAAPLTVEQVCLDSADWVVATNLQEEIYLRALVSSKERIYFAPVGVGSDRL